ncbi:MAG: EF-hand domain-containing protein [Sphingomonas paucimobilis]
MRSLIAAASLAGIALPAIVTAQTPPPPAPRPMADGVLTREEALARADRRFDALDTDRDGTISAAERAAMPQRPRGTADGATPMPGRHMGDRMLERADADRNGVITREEFRAVAARAFDRQDANYDGRVDAAERKQWRDQRMARRGARPAE